MAGRKSHVPINQLYEYVMTDNIYESVMIDSGSKASFVTVCLNEKDCSVRLTLVYGPQKNDYEDKDSFYHDISV